MAKSLITQTFGVPLQSVLELSETSDKRARLSDARYAFETKLNELEHQFETKASKLREAYLGEVLGIRSSWSAITTGPHRGNNDN